MINNKVLSIVAAFLFMSIRPVYAEQTPIAQLKKFLATTQSLTADFKQVTLSENQQPIQTSYGTFYLSRPGKFRWSYNKPFAQEIISNAGTVWFYDVDLEQVTVKKANESFGATPASLLSGEIELDDNFSLKQQGTDEGLEWVKLSPKNEQSSFQSLLIGFDKGEIGGMELSDNFGQLTRIYFSNIKKNKPIKASVFELVVPEGVDIFGQ